MSPVEDLQVLSAEQGSERMASEEKMPRSRFTPPVPIARDARLTFASWEAADPPPAASARRGVFGEAPLPPSAMPEEGQGLTFRDWMEASRAFDVHRLCSPTEERALRGRLVQPGLRQRVVEDPDSALLLVCVVAMAAGVALGWSASQGPAMYRGIGRRRAAAAPRAAAQSSVAARAAEQLLRFVR